MPHKVVTVHIVEDDVVVRGALSYQLKTAGYDTAEFSDAETLLETGTEALTGCLITDVRLPGMDGVSLINELNHRGATAPIIVVTAYPQIWLVVSAMRAGAVNFLEKPLYPPMVLSAVAEAVSGAGSNMKLRAEAMHASAQLQGLTAREQDIFDRFVEGLTSKQIAGDLQISPKTIETYRIRLYEKLGVNTPNALARLGMLALMSPMWERQLS